MTIRNSESLFLLGNIFRSKRESLSLIPNTRQHFIDDREDVNLIESGSISLKTLANIENGKNIPSLQTIKVLSAGLEVDELDLLAEIMPFIPIRN